MLVLLFLQFLLNSDAAEPRTLIIETEGEHEEIESPTPKKKKSSKKSSKIKAEGTPAKDRGEFENDPVVNSVYQYHGQPLVVDPD